MRATMLGLRVAAVVARGVWRECGRSVQREGQQESVATLLFALREETGLNEIDAREGRKRKKERPVGPDAQQQSLSAIQSNCHRRAFCVPSILFARQFRLSRLSQHECAAHAAQTMV